MNERIKELAKQANVRPLYSPAYAPRYIFEEEELEKFAELIVQDMIEVAAAHALLNKSALDVFVKQKEIYAKID